MNESRHIIAAAIIGVRICFTRGVLRKLIQYTFKNTTNSVRANAIDISSRAFEMSTEILNYLRFPSARRSMNKQKPESTNEFKPLARANDKIGAYGHEWVPLQPRHLHN